LEPLVDYNYIGSSSDKSQIAFTFDLLVGDKIDFHIDANA
jgi:hypothetical protein